jgi:hypothetical protein
MIPIGYGIKLKEDISEADNVAAKYPKVFEKMKEKLKFEYAELLVGSHIWKREVY